MIQRYVLCGLRWVASALIFWLACLAAMILAPIACLPFFVRKEGAHEYIGHPWIWATTFDAPADELAYSSHLAETFYIGRYTRAEIKRSAWLRYCNRVAWMWRNPAYQVGQWLGYDQVGMRYLDKLDNNFLWDSGIGNFSYWTFINLRGQVGFCLEWQWYFYRDRCLEIYIGWKHDRTDPDQVCMLAARVSPFKRYPRSN